MMMQARRDRMIYVRFCGYIACDSDWEGVCGGGGWVCTCIHTYAEDIYER